MDTLKEHSSIILHPSRAASKKNRLCEDSINSNTEQLKQPEIGSLRVCEPPFSGDLSDQKNVFLTTADGFFDAQKHESSANYSGTALTKKADNRKKLAGLQEDYTVGIPLPIPRPRFSASIRRTSDIQFDTLEEQLESLKVPT